MEDLLVSGLVYLEVHIPTLIGVLPPASGKEVFAPKLPVRLGGALNVASVLRALSAPVSLAIPLGRGLVAELVRHEVSGLDIGLVDWPSDHEGSVSIVFHAGGDRAFLSAADLAGLEAVRELPEAGWVHVPGLGEARSLRGPLALARSRGARLSLSTSWDPLGFELLRSGTELHFDLLVMNELEANELAGSPSEALRFSAARASDAVVTLGSGGAIASFRGELHEVRAPTAEVVDPTGAGDAFSGGLLAALHRGHPAKVALDWGVKASIQVLGRFGGVVRSPMNFDLETSP